MTRRTVEIIAFCIALLIAALAFHAWLSSHDDQLRLQSTLATQKKILDAADARERDRNAALKDTLAQIDALKRQTQTPEQILRELPKYISLPQPILLSPPGAAKDSGAHPNAAACAEEKSPLQQDVSPSSAHAAAPGTGSADNQQGTRAPAKQGTAASAKSFWRSLLHPHASDGDSRSRDGFAAPPTPPGQSASSSATFASTSHGGAGEPNADTQSRPADSDAGSPNSSATNFERPTASLSTDPSSRNQSEISPRATTLAAPSAQSQSAGSPPASATAQVPAADLKPLYDFVQDCRACQLQLAAAKQDAADNTLKITALTRERDAALASAKGGTFWLRLRRNALWLGIGAAASAGALCASGHCR